MTQPNHLCDSWCLWFGVQPLGCATQRRLKPVLQTSTSRPLGVFLSPMKIPPSLGPVGAGPVPALAPSENNKSQITDHG